MPKLPRPAPRPDPVLPLGRQLAESWAAQRRRYRKVFRATVRDPSPGHVHDLRVAIRRLLAHLDLLRTAPQPVAARRARRKLKALMQATAAARDAQVQLDLLPRYLSEEQHPELRRCVRRLESRARRQARKLVGVLRRKPTRLRSVDFDQFLQTPAAKRELRLRAALRLAFKEALTRLRIRLQLAGDGAPASLHDARIALKAFRYMAETARPGARRTRLFRQLQALQSALGEIHDLDLLQLRLEKLAAKDARTADWLRPRRLTLRRRRAALFRARPPLPDGLEALP